MKPKEYSIKSFDDICNIITDENQARLLEDIRLAFLSYLAGIGALKIAMPEATEGKRNTEICKFGFTWIDDGKHDLKGLTVEDDQATISVKFKDQK